MRSFLFIISFFTAISCIGQQKNPLRNFQAPISTKIIPSNGIQKQVKNIPVKDGKIYINPEKGSVKSENSIQYIIDYYELNDDYNFNEIKNSENSFRYQQFYKGLLVFGNEIVIHNENGSVKRVRGRISNQLNIDINPLISAKDAFLLGKEYLKLTSIKDTLVYDLIIHKHKEIFKTAYNISIESLKNIDSYRVFVDANTGEILNKISNIAHADIETNVVTHYSGQQPITTHLYQDNYYLSSEEKKIITQSWNNQLNASNVTNFYNNNNLWNDQEIILNNITISSMTNWWNLVNVNQCPDIRIKIYNNIGTKVKDIQYYDDCGYIYFNNLNLSSSNAPYTVRIYERDDTWWPIVGWDIDYDNGGSFVINLDNTESNNWSNGYCSGSYSTSLSISDEPQPHLDAHWGAEITHDYFTEKFSRNGFDNQGSQMRLFTNVGENYNNAGWVDEWNGFENFMIFGDGDGITKSFHTSLDIIGHEISHGLISSESCLDYIGESGALNESFADILGTAIEFFGKPENANWTLAEDIYLNPSGDFMRSLESPKLKGQPDTYGGLNWENPQNYDDDNGGVHHNSGVQNYWFYLLSNGGSGVNDNGDEYLVNGIGINKAIDVCYKNITEELTLLSDYEDAYIGSIDATENLISEGTLSENDLFSVKQAWYAVGVGPQPELYCDDETTTLVDAFGTLSDGSDELDYLDQTNCSWVIKPAAANKITIHFTEFDLEEGYDFVRIYNGVNPDPSALIVELTGTINPFDFEASTFQTSDDVGAILIEFVSNYSITSSGWSFDYYTDQDEIFCEGYSILSESSGTFDDGSGINNYYSNNQSCAWLIAPPCADSIYLEFNYLNIEQGYDSIWIFDGNTSLAPLLYANSGNWWPTDLESVTSTTGEMLVIFWSDFTESNFLGFEAYYNSYGAVNCSETTILTDTSGVISDYSLEEEYCNNSECYYLIQPENSASIDLEFTEFELEDSPFGDGYYDYVQVFDGDSEEAPLIGTFGGSSIPGLIQSSGGSLYIKFKTDIAITYQGWAANWTSHAIEPICSTSHTLVLQSADSLGWDDNSLHIQLYNNNGSFVDSTITLVDGSIDFYCVNLNSDFCNSFILNNDDLEMGDSWSLYSSEINLDLNLVTTSTTDYYFGCVSGCTDENALNYDNTATIDDNSCILPVYGCTDYLAINFDPSANVDDQSCIEIVYGCTDPIAFNFNDEANTDNGTCEDVIFGCTNTEASNYNQNANTDDNGCIAVSNGCTNPEALNFNASANTDNNACLLPILGCIDNGLTFEDLIDNITYEEIPDGLDDDYKYDVNGDNLPALNFNPLANVNDGNCVPTIYGCTDVSSLNYNVNANSDDNTCIQIIFGCMDINADNYHAFVNTDNGSCEYEGCTDPNANNYNTEANIDNNSCTYSTIGCMDSLFLEYNAFANTSDPTACLTIILTGCTELNSINYNNSANLDDGSCIAIVEGCTDATFTEYDAAANTNDGSCAILVVEGCTNILYTEYNATANTIDGSCATLVLEGCTNILYTEYNATANTDDGSCAVLVVEGCIDSNANNYNSSANTDDGSCLSSTQEIPEGYCIPNTYTNSYTNYIRRFALDTLDSGYNSSLNQFSSSYTDNSELVVGLEAGSNYSAFVNIISQGTQQGFSGQIGLAILIDYNRDGDFEDANEICFSSTGNSLGNNQNSINYSPTINVPVEIQSGLTKIRVITYLTSDYPSGTNFGCISDFNGEVEDYTANLINDILGCTDVLAENYDAFATIEDGSCDYTGCTNPASISYDSNATIDDYSCVLSTEFNNYDIFLQPFPRYEPIKWSPYGGTTNQILEDYGTSNGVENTENIIEIYGTEEEYAASYCQNLDLYGFTDWYLPSSDEFGAFSNYFATDWSILDYYSNTEITSWNNSPNPTIGGVFNQPDWTGVYYWTSNESNQEGKANLKKLNPHSIWHDEKTTDHPVRCMRNNAIEGCTDASAQNFNQFASINDGTCNYYPNCQNLNFPAGWSIFSTYMIAESMDMSDLLDPIIDNVLISKNNSGAAFLVEWAFNGIGNVLIGQGYQIKTNSVTEFDLCGEYAVPNEHPIVLVAGWNIIGYLNTEPESASIVLQDIISSDNLLIAKDYMGSAYLPQFNFNGIGSMNPGQGYQIKVIIPDILQY